ncbi:hypothetical protein LIER_08802 [Lithospermum erythrorhizon]|uniref:Uncharacterized protein n=1 Tax=Lithospermum erythrorhizon TaxID=34254 RepID=A0AAV3PDF4_LITER
MRFCNINEAYIPDRVTRQFGRVQGIPGNPIIHVPPYVLSTNPRSYKKKYGNQDFLWEGRTTIHRFRPHEFGLLVGDSPEFSVPHYLQWYEECSYVRVSNPAHKAAPEDDDDLGDTLATVHSHDTHDWHEVQLIVLSRMGEDDPDLLVEGYQRLHDLLVRRGL